MIEKTLLHVELISDTQMNFKISGNPVVLTAMTNNAMHQKQDIAAAIIVAVYTYLKEQGIPPERLHDLVTIPDTIHGSLIFKG